MFFRRRVITLHRVHDTVRVREGGETLTLRVDGDAMRMVAGMNDAQARLKTLTSTTPQDAQREIALFFASVIFGDQQAEALFDFYRNDAICVISVCGRYFNDRLARLIKKAQTK